ncbi:MAG: hypothetical protein HKN70_15330, partial [Gammaproteobacteria bacterium]|nr:hypothetical protein [Gammaproteobacteria bacterium]
MFYSSRCRSGTPLWDLVYKKMRSINNIKLNKFQFPAVSPLFFVAVLMIVIIGCRADNAGTTNESQSQTTDAIAQEITHSPFPDLQWQPHEFVYQSGRITRYIDYRDGDDQHPGTREQPWKHHPWDARALG